MVNELVRLAVNQRASDIHLEPKHDKLRVRMRVDGALVNVQPVSLAVSPNVVSRVKVLAKIDVAERRNPQDGQIAIELDGGRRVQLRASTFPASQGEKVVLADPVEPADHPVRGARRRERRPRPPCASALAAAGLRRHERPDRCRQDLDPLCVDAAHRSPARQRRRARDHRGRDLRTDARPGERARGCSPSPPGCAPSCDRTRTSSWSARCVIRRPPASRCRPRSPDISCSRRCIPPTRWRQSCASSTSASSRGSWPTRSRRCWLNASCASRVRIASGPGSWSATSGTPTSFSSCRQPCRRAQGCDKCMRTGYRGRTGMFEVVELDDDLRELVKAKAPARAYREIYLRRKIRVCAGLVSEDPGGLSRPSTRCCALRDE